MPTVPRTPRDVTSASQRQPLLPTLLAAAIGVMLAPWPSPARAQAAQAASRAMDIDLPAQPLAQALTALSRQTGVQVFAGGELVGGRAAPEVKGRFSVQQALDRLLAGSGLVAVFEGANVVIRAAPTENRAETTLAPVTVTGRAEADGKRSTTDLVERVSKGTALFGAADLRDVPFTVNVVTSSEIANRQAKTLGEALAGDPAVLNDYGGTGGYPTESFNIRGFQIGGGNAFLKDGMPMAGQVTQGTENIDQIEVVRGPMAFRYGFIPPGGAINLVSKKPTDSPLRSVTLSVDQYGSAKEHVDLGGRFGDDARFGYRINLVNENSKLFFEPVTKDRTLFSTALDLRVSQDTLLTFAYDRNHYRSGPDVFHYTIPDADGNELKGLRPDGYWGIKSLPDNDFLVQTASFGIESDLTNNLHLSSTTSFYDSDTFYSLSLPGNAQANGDFSVSVNKAQYRSRVVSNTTYLNGKADIAGLRHSLTVGVSLTNTDFQGKTAGGGELAGLNNFYNPVQLLDTTPNPSGPYTKFSEDQQRGVFVSDEIKLGEAWRVLLALRHSSYEDVLGAKRDSSTDPTVGVMVDISKDVSVYGSYGSGLEPGGTAPETAANRFEKLGAQKSSQVELGVKSDLLSGALTLDAALFSIEKAAEFTNAANVYVQSGRERHDGVEARLTGKLTETFTVSTGFQTLHAKLTGDPATAGTRPMNVPKLHATFYGDYRLAAIPGLHLTGGAYYTGEREISIPNINAKAAAYTRFDLGARYETRLVGHDVIGRVTIENIADKTYYNSGWSSLYEFGAPRTVSASFELKF